MNNQLQKGNNPFNQIKVANKAIAIQKDLHKTQVEHLGFSQIDMHDLVSNGTKLFGFFRFCNNFLND